jgi:hypothetical protein
VTGCIWKKKDYFVAFLSIPRCGSTSSFVICAGAPNENTLATNEMHPNEIATNEIATNEMHTLATNEMLPLKNTLATNKMHAAHQVLMSKIGEKLLYP